MSALFPVEPVYPEGVFYFPAFLGEAEEQQLCKEVERVELHSFNFQGFEARRKVASFGYDYSFDSIRLQTIKAATSNPVKSLRTE